MEQRQSTTTLCHILEAVRKFGMVSIKDIATFCNQSIPSVSRYVDILLERGILRESVSAVAATGRKPKLFWLNPEYGYIVGVELGRQNIVQIAVFSLDRNLLYSVGVPYEKNVPGSEIIERVMLATERIFRDNALDIHKVLQIVLANPGVVEPNTGTMNMAAKAVTWSNLPIRIMFQERFGVPAAVINDINLSAIGEREFGAGKGYRNFLFVRLDAGIKAGIILENELYLGETHSAGEIGNCQVTVLRDGRLRRVPAEAMFSISAICDAIAAVLPEYPDDLLYSITGGDPQNVTLKTIVKVLGTSSFVNTAVSEIAEQFGHLLLNMIATLDLPLIIIGGDIVQLGNFFLKPVRDVLTEYMQTPPTVVDSPLGENVALLGAFAVGMENFINDI